MFFFYNDTATTEIYTLSLHDALPICNPRFPAQGPEAGAGGGAFHDPHEHRGGKSAAPGNSGAEGQAGWIRHASADAKRDRKSKRLKSSHLVISYAVFCLKKKKTNATS